MCEKVVMAEKRKLEFDSLSGVSEAESADIHGVIASVSPMKKGKRASYFDCKLTLLEINFLKHTKSSVLLQYFLAHLIWCYWHSWRSVFITPHIGVLYTLMQWS